MEGWSQYIHCTWTKANSCLQFAFTLSSESDLWMQESNEDNYGTD